MEPDLEPIVVMPNPNGNPEDSCQVLFDGDYHYCGEAGVGLVKCCLGVEN